MVNQELVAYHNLVPVLAFSIDPAVFWPYAAGAAILVVGFPVVMMGAARRARGLDKLAAFGPTLFGIAMAVFGADHFVGASFVASIVPSWIPWHLFWTYFVGTALIAGGLSFATGIQWRLAAASFVAMLLIFELTIHLPNLYSVPHDRLRLTLVLREFSLMAGCLAFAASQVRQTATAGARSGALFSALVSKRLVAVACFLLAIPVGKFGIEHFLNRNFAPGIPQDNPRLKIPMPSWLPAHTLWIYLTGSIFVVCAIALITRRYARAASGLIGATILVITALVYLPVTIARASDVANGLNYLAIHFALAGSALMLAGALPSRSPALAAVPEPEPAGLERVASS
jgi:uncharacterized membrane protein